MNIRIIRLIFKIMGSHWTGTVEDAFFDGESFNRNRIIQRPEYEATNRSRQVYYVLAVDVGRKGCNTEVLVFKVTPHAQGDSVKTLVNIYSIEETHFEEQAIKLKQLYYKFNAKRIVIDGNGLGIGLLDYMVKAQTDQYGDSLPDFGIYGGTYNGADQEYKNFRTPNTEENAIYVIKANAPINTEAYSAVQSQMNSGKLKFLVDERTAQNKLMGTKVGQKMTPEQREEYLMPFTLTSNLKEEILNLREEREGINIILKQASRGIKKDKFSALCYGIYYIRQEEDLNKKKKKRFNAKDWVLYN